MVGNIPNFSKIDIMRCFLRFNKNLSRQELAKELELGEGTVRTILNTLKSKRLLKSTKKGHELSEKGRNIMNAVKEIIEIKKIEIKKFFPSFKKVGIAVRESPEEEIGYKQRDVAIKNGAEGALLLRYDKKLYLPNVDYDSNFNELDIFKLKKGNILAVTFANDYRWAEISALAVVMSMSRKADSVISKIL